MYDEGGSGVPILLLHGLMGSARTWRSQLDWLREFGHVYTFDAAGHGRPLPEHWRTDSPGAAPYRFSTEDFVADLHGQIRTVIDEPMVVIGHSMGGLHGLTLTAAHPELVRALVVEDIAPDFRGRTADDWAAVISAWPQPFPDEAAVLEFFGPVAGRYFLDSFVHGPDGYRLHGEVEIFRLISEEWGSRDFWDEWKVVTVPALLLEGEYTITPPGQMAEMARVHPMARHVVISGAGHLVHDDQPAAYRAEVEDFLRRVLV